MKAEDRITESGGFTAYVAGGLVFRHTYEKTDGKIVFWSCEGK